MNRSNLQFAICSGQFAICNLALPSDNVPAGKKALSIIQAPLANWLIGSFPPIGELAHSPIIFVGLQLCLSYG
jgi:hypothetical protein